MPRRTYRRSSSVLTSRQSLLRCVETRTFLLRRTTASCQGFVGDLADSGPTIVSSLNVIRPLDGFAATKRPQPSATSIVRQLAGSAVKNHLWPRLRLSAVVVNPWTVAAPGLMLGSVAVHFFQRSSRRGTMRRDPDAFPLGQLNI